MIVNLSAAELAQELREIEAESIGWSPLDKGIYLHRGAQEGSPADLVIEVVGLPDATMAGLNLLLITG